MPELEAWLLSVLAGPAIWGVGRGLAVLALTVVVGWVVDRQLGVLGVPAERSGWPALPWRRAAVAWSRGLVLCLAGGLLLAGGLSTGMWATLTATWLSVGLAGGTLGVTALIGAHVGEDGPADRRLVLLGGGLLAVSTLAGGAWWLLVSGGVLGGLAVAFASVDTKRALATRLADVAAGLQLMAHRQASGGHGTIRVRQIGLLSSRVDDGHDEQRLSNSEVWELVRLQD